MSDEDKTHYGKLLKREKGKEDVYRSLYIDHKFWKTKFRQVTSLSERVQQHGENNS